MSLKSILDHFYYDESSYSCLRRKVDWVSGKNGCTIRAKAGDATGSLTDKGYYTVYCGKLIFAHKVVWLLHGYDVPDGMCLDHINGDRKDNNINNLRLVTYKQNSQNSFMKNTNVSGYNGVHERKEGKSHRFIVQSYKPDGRRYSKSFSITKYGYDTALQMAIEHRDTIIQMLNNSGEYYTSRHGTRK